MIRLSTFSALALFALATESRAQLPGSSDSTSPVDSLVITCYFEPVPELIGGVETLTQRAQYTQAAREAGVEGHVVVSMFVEPDGSVSEVEIYSSLGYGLDEEAVRVVRQAKFAWPEGATPQRVRVMLPIRYSLTDG